jgi:hypothetical protein
MMSMQVIDDDPYTSMVVYRSGRHTLAREKIGTRYVVTASRTLVDPAHPKDVQQAQALQEELNHQAPFAPPNPQVRATTSKFT